jgi:hypothetical protein
MRDSISVPHKNYYSVQTAGQGLGARSLQFVFDDLATLHHELNSLQLGNIL